MTGETVQDDCGWIAQAGDYTTYPSVSGEEKTDWAVIGGGYTGVAAARRLAALEPQARIMLIEGKRIAQGASARNSGFVVANESPRHIEHGDASGWKDYTTLNRLARSGIAELRGLVDTHPIECQWEDTGSIHCAADPGNFTGVREQEEIFRRQEVPCRLIEGDALAIRLGTPFYKLGLLSEGGALVQPAMLIKGLVEALPEQVERFENSPVHRIEHGDGSIILHLPGGTVKAGKVIVGVNAFFPRLGLHRRQVFPLAATASLTRPLTSNELAHLGGATSWGVLAARSFGATVRLTMDNRILMRNTMEYRPGGITPKRLAGCRAIHIKGLARRFPWLSTDAIAHSWSGSIGVSRNSKPVFGEIREGLYAAGCYNGAGVSRGTILGKLIADMALGNTSELLSETLALTKPPRMPPRPFFDVGVHARLAYERITGASER